MHALTPLYSSEGASWASELLFLADEGIPRGHCSEPLSHGTDTTVSMTIQTILVPTDLSPPAQRALEYAVQFARSLSAQIHLLHACGIEFPFLEPTLRLPDLTERIRNDARAALEPLERRLSESGVRYKSHLSAELPVPAILHLAASISADLIIMGTRGLTGVRHWMLGSVAERIVRIAPCSVLTVKTENT